MRICIICNKSYTPIRTEQKYCSYDCRLEAARRKYKAGDSGLAKATVGTLAELRVAVDLLLKGYEVFRAVSSACSCDLAILKNGKLLRVEVKTGAYYNGKLYANKGKIHQYDILAIVDPIKNQILYKGSFD